MTLNFRHLLIGALVALGVGYGIGRYLQPAEIKIKKEEIVRTDKVIVDRYITRPDGTVERERREENRTEVVRREDKQIVAAKPQWKVSAFGGLENGSLALKGGAIERRILGSIFVGAGALSVKSDITPVLSLGFEF